ncbi:MAG: endonuclease NucS [candidate division Zixibacteria bacterium]|nr:endonuclease NucS [candidate division Zixibacteria bacterium]
MINKDYWNKFIKSFTTDKSYWYVPKGKTINQENLFLLREQLKILKKYEKKDWREYQKVYTDELNKKKLIEHRAKGQKPSDYTAIARMLKVIFDLLGVAWVDKESKVYITSTGDEFIKTNKLDQIVKKQLLKYQFYNPSYREEYFRCIKLFPHLFLLEILFEFYKTGISKDEYVLSVSRAKSHEQLSEKIELIRKFRELSRSQRASLISKLEKVKIKQKGKSSRRSSIYNTIFLNHSYSLNFFTYPEYIKVSNNKIILAKNRLKEVESLIKEHREKAVYVDFENEKDWLAFYGDFEKGSSYLNALNYYEDKININKSLEIFREAKKKNLIPLEEKEEAYIEARIKEKMLEDFLEFKLDELEKGLTLIRRQYPTLVGPIDILAKDLNGNYVVIELKKGRSSDRVFGQITRYIGWIKDNLNPNVRGIVVGSPIEDKLVYSRKGLNNLERVKLKEFNFYFKFSDKG